MWLLRFLFVSGLPLATGFVPGSSNNSVIRFPLTERSVHSVDQDHSSQIQSIKNVAQYLVDLHDNKATLDFCGGMMFQLVLSDQLRTHLQETAAQSDNDKLHPVIHSANKRRMHDLDDYQQNGQADNIHLFHGREIRQVPHAKGGMGFVLQLCLANANDPQGWTSEEIKGYDGWGHDVGRTWRQGDVLEQEGFVDFRKQFGPDSFALHHRFYLHFDNSDRVWLSAEDGCEGTPSNGARNPLSSLFGMMR